MLYIKETDKKAFAEHLAKGEAFDIESEIQDDFYRIFPVRMGYATFFYSVTVGPEGFTFQEYACRAELAAVEKNGAVYHMAKCMEDPEFEFSELRVYSFSTFCRAAAKRAKDHTAKMAAEAVASSGELSSKDNFLIRNTARKFVLEGKQSGYAKAEMLRLYTLPVSTEGILNDLCGFKSIEAGLDGWNKRNRSEQGGTSEFDRAALRWDRIAHMMEDPDSVTEEWERRLARSLRLGIPEAKTVTAVFSVGGEDVEAKIPPKNIIASLEDEREIYGFEFSGKPDRRLTEGYTPAAAGIKELRYRGKAVYTA